MISKPLNLSPLRFIHLILPLPIHKVAQHIALKHASKQILAGNMKLHTKLNIFLALWKILKAIGVKINIYIH